MLLEVGGKNKRAIVKSRVKDTYDNPIGNKNDNYILDTREYKVVFEDGSTDIYTSNIIMENIYSQIDDKGNLFVLMDDIIDHKRDATAIDKSNGTYYTKTGTLRKKITTAGWQLLVSWKDGTSSWVKLSDLKESFPVEVAQYARDKGILDEQAFVWWAPFTLNLTHGITRD